MSGWTRNLLLGAVIAVLIGIQWLILPDPSRRNLEYVPNMMESVAHDAQSPMPLVAGGLAVDLRPPEGSVARDFPPLGLPATPEGALRAAEEWLDPLAEDESDSLERGAFVFATFCVPCHGAGGHGDGPATRLGVPPPPSLLAEHAVQMKDGQMFHIISLGQGNMASYASQVERIDRWRAIRYIRSLQQAALAASIENAPEGDDGADVQ